MCEYSLMHLESRPAVVGEKLKSLRFGNPGTVGFAGTDDAKIPVCLMPGTELAFDGPVEYQKMAGTGVLYYVETPHCAAVFRQVDKDDPYAHHDAVEFPDGLVVKLTFLKPGQRATVLQLPAKTIDEVTRTGAAAAILAT